jgi:hypothetical protein
MLRLARAVDALYEAVVTHPEVWNDDRLAEWAADVSGEGEPIPPDALKQLRAGMRNARRIRMYWRDGKPPADWEMAVDQALGGMGWNPGLRLAELDLETTGDAEAFAEVRRRFRMVNSVPWMEGVSYEDWLRNR